MKSHDIAMIGFGNVGQGVAQIVKKMEVSLRDPSQIAIRIVAVSDIRWGTIVSASGFDPDKILGAVLEKGSFAGLEGYQKGWDALRTIRESNAQTIVELSPTDLSYGEPALSHIRAALESGKHAVTTNKGPIALHYSSLKRLADLKGVALGVEGTVMSGTPAIRLGKELRSAGLNKIMGILNGTTNFILTRMQTGEPYSSALEEAQELGYAETDPTGDVEGHDAAAKLVILANVLMESGIGLKDVHCQGITRLTLKDIQQAASQNECWKLIATLERHAGGGVSASVQPQKVKNSHPLASVNGATNAITYSTDHLGDVTLIGPGAGRVETGYAILSDLLAIQSGRIEKPSPVTG